MLVSTHLPKVRVPVFPAATCCFGTLHMNPNQATNCSSLPRAYLRLEVHETIVRIEVAGKLAIGRLAMILRGEKPLFIAVDRAPNCLISLDSATTYSQWTKRLCLFWTAIVHHPM